MHDQLRAPQAVSPDAFTNPRRLVDGLQESGRLAAGCRRRLEKFTKDLDEHQRLPLHLRRRFDGMTPREASANPLYRKARARLAAPRARRVRRCGRVDARPRARSGAARRRVVRTCSGDDPGGEGEPPAPRRLTLDAPPTRANYTLAADRGADVEGVI